MQEQASYVKQKTIDASSYIGEGLVKTKDNAVLSSKQIYNEGISASSLQDTSKSMQGYMYSAAEGTKIASVNAITSSLTGANNMITKMQKKLDGTSDNEQQAQQQNVVNIDADSFQDVEDNKDEQVDNNVNDPQENQPTTTNLA